MVLPPYTFLLTNIRYILNTLQTAAFLQTSKYSPEKWRFFLPIFWEGQSRNTLIQKWWWADILNV